MTVQDLRKLIEYWFLASSEDLQVARGLFKSKRYSYCMFFCHLSLEKMLKAFVVAKTKDHAPFTHNLPFLAGKADLVLDKNELAFLSEMNRWNLEARYPSDIDSMKKSINVSIARRNLSMTEKFLSCLKSKLQKN